MKTKESQLQFPCDFSIKIIGKATDEFEIAVATILRKYIPDFPEGAIKTKLSRDGNYLAMTANIVASSQDLLDSIYRELSANEQVIMAI